ncbi:MAG TPA: dephospho-CoA kinase [Dermatophilaceae bacterium]|jgi:dephospho-CoA kinase|nr:dephospho-CoA kinase [Dermatophilaceae bacterium]
MLRIGLSGGIGSGKSTVAQRFSQLGAILADADQIAREVVQPGTPGLSQVVERFGPGVLAADGALDRAALGAIVFADPEARSDLEAITHPLIARRTGQLLAAAPADGVFVHDVPLLVEKRMGAGYHLVVVVTAEETTRLERLLRERGMTAEEALSRIRVQATDEERRAAADVLLVNMGTREELVASVDKLWHERLVPFAHNLAHGIRSRRSERLSISEPDPTWPAQAQRLLARLQLAFGPAGVTADHVGSTAVPGLAAKDVIDLQVGVASLQVADEPHLLRRLGDAGFPRAAGTWADTDRRSGGRLPKRLHGSCDPGRVVHIHVREVGSPGWRWSLLFRDWMRADERAREEYAGLKRTLAARLATTSEYADAKEPWFDEVGQRAEAWAARSGWEPAGG